MRQKFSDQADPGSFALNNNADLVDLSSVSVSVPADTPSAIDGSPTSDGSPVTPAALGNFQPSDHHFEASALNETAGDSDQPVPDLFALSNDANLVVTSTASESITGVTNAISDSNGIASLTPANGAPSTWAVLDNSQMSGGHLETSAASGTPAYTDQSNADSPASAFITGITSAINGSGVTDSLAGDGEATSLAALADFQSSHAAAIVTSGFIGSGSNPTILYSSEGAATAFSGSGQSATQSNSGNAAAVSAANSQTITEAGSGLVFVNTYGSGVDAAYQSAIITAENYWQSQFSNSVTLYENFTLAPLSASDIAENDYSYDTVSYSQLAQALAANAVTSDQLAAVASLPAQDPSNGKGFALSWGEATILGLSGQTTNVDSVTLNSNLFTNDADFAEGGVGAIEHEISEGGMGRIGSLGVASPYFEPMDLFRYSSPGVRDFNPNSQAYFSVNGSTLTLPFNVPYTNGVFNGSDFGDWASSVSGDVFGDESVTSTNTVSATDLAVMQVLGWTPAGAGVELVASNLGFGGYNPATGQLTLTYDVQNTGGSNASSSTTGFYYYTGSTLFGNLYATQSIPGIAGGSTAAESYTGLLPQNVYNAPIQVVINYNDAVKEQNTNGDPLPALLTVSFDTTSLGGHTISGTAANDVMISTNTAGDIFNGEGGTDTMYGVGNDTFELWSHGPGTDYTDYITVTGSNNTLDYSKSPGAVVVNLQTGVTSNYYGGTDYFGDIQNVIASVYADTIIAQTGGGDTLTASGGSTTFDMSGGTSFINGGSGFSTLNYSFSPGPITLSMVTGTTSYYYGGTDHFSNIESVIGTAFNDRLIAGAGGAELNGGAGNDTLIGGTGSVTFDLWSHAPGTSYSDYITGGTGYNVLDYTQSPGPVNLSLVTGVASDYYGGSDHVSNIDQVNGSAFNDWLAAGAASAVLNGEAGSNTLVGGSTGTDTFELWSHAPGTAYINYISPGKGYNILDYSQSPGAVSVAS